MQISYDGEEGYEQAQQRLNQQHFVGCDREVDRESVHPPPNRTVYDGESPPPYRARRFTHPTGGSIMDCKHVAGATDRSASAAKMPTQVIIGNGGSPVVRGLSNNNNTNNVNLNSSCLGGAMTQHPSYQYHPPHVAYPQTGAAAHNGHLRAPSNHHHNHHRRESPTTAATHAQQPSSGHSRHSSSSSSNSARSSLGSPPNYDDVIANKFTTRHSGSDV